MHIMRINSFDTFHINMQNFTPIQHFYAQRKTSQKNQVYSQEDKQDNKGAIDDGNQKSQTVLQARVPLLH